MNMLNTARYMTGLGRICRVKGRRRLMGPMVGGLGEAVQFAIDHMTKEPGTNLIGRNLIGTNLIEMCSGLYGLSQDEAP